MLEIKFGKKLLHTDKPAFVMGILNVTPDSFFSESRGGIDKAFQLIEQGADILDIGGESTRPGYTEISTEEQLKRILPVIKEIRNQSDIAISIDTRNSAVFQAAFDAGADVFNDVSGFEDDEKSIEVLSKTGAGVIIMHRAPEPTAEEAKNQKTDKNILKTVSSILESKIQAALKGGVSAEKIIVDPGIGFGKTFEENLELIKHCGKICDGAYPVLMALSRKRCIGTMLERENDAMQRLTGTVAANLLSVQNGAKMVRVHDVQETVDALNVMKYLK